MATVKISALTAATSLTADDYMVVVDDPGGTPTTKRITGQILKDFVLAGVVSSSAQVTAYLPNGTVSSSAQVVSNISGQYIVPSGSNFQGIVSGSGTSYRLIAPVGTNYYAT